MRVCLVLPIRSLREGKTRLASVLDAQARESLIVGMLHHVLQQAARFPGLQYTLVVSPCADARAYATRFGARALEEAIPNLNRALTQAHREARATGAEQLMVVPCDLPLVSEEDLRQLAIAYERTVAIAPDSHGTGTNGLCVPAAASFDFAFGPESFVRHGEAVRRLGFEVQIVRRAGLAFDLDTPDDLQRVRELPAPHIKAAQ